MKTIFAFLCLFSVQLLSAQKTFDRADFYINTNECLNCQMYLPNYAITLQNSDTIYLHMDKETRRFGVKYLKSKGVNIAIFDSVFYENLLKKHDGYFDSYIVLKQAAKIDTVLVKVPLLLKQNKNYKLTENADCGETTNRVTAFYGYHSFILNDYLLEKTFKYNTVGEKVTDCSAAVFQAEKHAKKYNDYIKNHGVSLDLTDAMRPLLRQLGKDYPKIESVSADGNNGFNAIVKIPYVGTLANGDTAISALFILQNSHHTILGMFEPGLSNLKKSNPDIDHYQPKFAGGFIYSNGKMIVEMYGPKPESVDTKNVKYIGTMELDSSGYFALKKKVEIEIPEEFDAYSESMGFNENMIYLKRAPFFYDLSNKMGYTFPVGEDFSNAFELYNVAKIDSSDKNQYRMVYRLDNTLFISVFNPITNELTTRNQMPVTTNQYAVPLKNFVFVLTDGGPSLPYLVLKYAD